MEERKQMQESTQHATGLCNMRELSQCALRLDRSSGGQLGFPDGDVMATRPSYLQFRKD